MRPQLLLTLLLATPAIAVANPITVVATTTASGELGPGRFNDVPVTFTFVADTGQLTMPTTGTYRLDQAQPTTITVGSQGTYAFADFTYAYLDNGVGGLADNNTGLRAYTGTSGLDVTSFAVNLGTVAGTIPNTLNGAAINLANGQNINFFASAPVDFRATYGTPASVAVTPEPSSLALLGTGLAGILGVARRRLHARRS